MNKVGYKKLYDKLSQAFFKWSLGDCPDNFCEIKHGRYNAAIMFVKDDISQEYYPGIFMHYLKRNQMIVRSMIFTDYNGCNLSKLIIRFLLTCP